MSSASEIPPIADARFAAGASATEQLPPPTGVEIAFAGRSNVGKSTLMNALMARRNLVRTSSTPGCTRQISFFETDFSDGSRVTLVDLPGYGYAKRSKAERARWGELIEGYLLRRQSLRCVCILVDVRRGLEREEADLVEMLSRPSEADRPALELLVVATKTDKLPASQRKLAVEAIRKDCQLAVLPSSPSDAKALVRIWRRLRRAAELERPAEPGSIL